MALLPPPAVRPQPKTTLSIRIDRATLDLLDRYCEFAACGRQHIVQEALRLAFEQDREFQRWLKERATGPVQISPADQPARRA